MNEDLARSEWKRLGHSQFVSNHIIDHIPYVFKQDHEAYFVWRQEVGSLLDVDAGNVFLVGSASVGCSLSPHKRFREFGNHSDIDVAIISTYHFDSAWRALRALNRADARSKDESLAISEHKKRLIFDGCIATDKFLGLLPFGVVWLSAAITISGLPYIGGLAVNFRIYQDSRSLRDFHERGTRRLFGG